MLHVDPELTPCPFCRKVEVIAVSKPDSAGFVRYACTECHSWYATGLGPFRNATPPGAAATPQGGTLTVAEPVARHDLSPAVSVFPPNEGV